MPGPMGRSRLVSRAGGRPRVRIDRGTFRCRPARPRLSTVLTHATPGIAFHPEPPGGQPVGADAACGPVLAQPLVRVRNGAASRGDGDLRDRVPPRPRAVALGPGTLL